MSRAVSAIVRYNRARRHAEALAAADDARGRGERDAYLEIARCDALVGLHRFGDAHELLGELLDADHPQLRPALLVRRAHVLRRSSRHLVAGLEAARAASRAAARLGPAAGATRSAAHREAARLFARKGCSDLAHRELESAREALPASVEPDYDYGRVCMALDDRSAARRAFDELAGDPRPMAAYYSSLGRAHLAFVMGEFDGAHDALDGIELAPGGDLWPRRLRCLVLHAQGRWLDAVAAFDDLIETSPAADTAWSDRYERAVCFYRAGRLSDAIDACARLVADAPDGRPAARRARRMMALLERGAARPVHRLEEFPSVTQLRDHCGPAACESYMRYFGLGSDQVAIARQVKRTGGGTPMHRIRGFLDDAGFDTWRVEAELPALKRLIRAGVPVLVEEAYAASNHVAVATGFDDNRDVLELHDPISHQVRETPYEDLAGLRNLSNHGGLVAVPRTDPRRRAAIDEARVVECEYIALVDRAWASYEAGDVAGADELCARALEIEPAYELAWMYRFRRARERVQRATGDRADILEVLAEVTHRWPDDEWPQQLLGQALMFDNRFDEARAAFERARQRDPDDPQNWAMIAECHLRAGQTDLAYDALVESLARGHSQVRAHENLASLACERDERELAWVCNDVALELAPDNAFNHGVRGRLLEREGELEASAASYDRALSLDPRLDWAASRRALVAARLGDLDGAVDRFRQRIAAEPGNRRLRVELADMLLGAGAVAAAIGECDALLDEASSPAARAIRGAALIELGQLDEGVADLEAAIEASPGYSWAYGRLGQALVARGEHRAGIAALAAAVATGNDPRDQYRLGTVMVERGHPGDGLRHLRAAALAGGLSETELAALGELMLSNGEDPEPMLASVARQQTDELGALRAHARLLVDRLWMPRRAAPVIERIAALAPDDPYAIVARGRARLARGLHDEPQGELDLREAVALAPELPFARRSLAEALCARGRFAEAFDLLEPLAPTPPTEALRIRALLGNGDHDRAAGRLDRFDAGPGLEYLVARARGDWARAATCAESMSRETLERDDDGRLDYWEQQRFECLLALGARERAARFGRAQAYDAGSAGRLADAALRRGDTELADEFAGRALRLHGDCADALAALGRCRELAGDIDGAFDAWRHLVRVAPDDWRGPEAIARACLGTGDADTAREQAHRSVARGHLCPWTFAVRAQVYLLDGDAAQASADVTRARAVASIEQRESEGCDIWAIRDWLRGDRASAQRWFDQFLAGPTSRLDRSRVATMRELLQKAPALPPDS